MVRRFGGVIGTVPEKLELYKALHADETHWVRGLLRKYNYHNFSIFITRMDDGKEYLFQYYEYTGDDYEKDTEALMAEPKYAEWLSQTDPCQIPLSGNKSWKMMDSVFYME